MEGSVQDVDIIDVHHFTLRSELFEMKRGGSISDRSIPNDVKVLCTSFQIDFTVLRPGFLLISDLENLLLAVRNDPNITQIMFYDYPTRLFRKDDLVTLNITQMAQQIFKLARVRQFTLFGTPDLWEHEMIITGG